MAELYLHIDPAWKPHFTKRADKCQENLMSWTSIPLLRHDLRYFERRMLLRLETTWPRQSIALSCHCQVEEWVHFSAHPCIFLPTRTQLSLDNNYTSSLVDLLIAPNAAYRFVWKFLAPLQCIFESINQIHITYCYLFRIPRTHIRLQAAPSDHQLTTHNSILPWEHEI